ncbi:hypothetical protein HAX54_028937 [Datura stramonium]|uniref:Uncharacterized protein n=1 Tax=Datura stramonium TaxID=4076 RepID=A0ABS8V6F7_DATST|nr:hypothetical protein [Datura stramonium]
MSIIKNKNCIWIMYEGAANEDGKGPSIWDTFTHNHPERIADHSNGDVAIDFYHRYKDDIKLMKYEGLNGFRFSISWSRVLPYGKLCRGKQRGIAFYNNLINELLAKAMTFEIMQSCASRAGDRVKLWTTINEPSGYALTSYDLGIFPLRCSWRDIGCPAGDSSTEPYIVAHHLLLAHAQTAKLYRHKYQKKDVDAAQRAIDFSLGCGKNGKLIGEPACPCLFYR